MTSIVQLIPWACIAVPVWLISVGAAYWAVLRISPAWSLGVIFGAKLLKLIILASAILAVKRLTQIPLMPFAYFLFGTLVVTIVFETFIFLYLKKKTNNENKQ